MQETKNLKLKKPDYSDVADIADINANMDILDEEVQKNKATVSELSSNKADKTHNHNNGADLKNVNASKLGGKSVGDFAACSVISNGDFNAVVVPGLYAMRSCSNSPDGGNYYGLLVVKSDTGSYVEQMAFKENTRKVFVRYCYGADGDSGELNWYGWEEIGSKYTEKLRIFDVDGKTLKETDGTNDLASVIPKQITANEARITGFDTSKYWFNFGIPNQTMKVPYSDMAIRALSFGKGAIPADTGMVRNVEGITDSIMNDPLFPVGYVTRSHLSPYSPVNGREFHNYVFSVNTGLRNADSYRRAGF